MGTRSNIAKVNADGSVNVIYCHWDGYVEGVGQTLAKHYTNPLKVEGLIALGDLSSIGKEVGTSNDFNNPNYDICVAYGRDRGETDTEPAAFMSLEDYLNSVKNDVFIEYVYVFENGEWTVHSNQLVVSPISLTNAVKEVA